MAVLRQAKQAPGDIDYRAHADIALTAGSDDLGQDLWRVFNIQI